jgi:hypothetical protein
VRPDGHDAGFGRVWDHGSAVGAVAVGDVDGE